MVDEDGTIWLRGGDDDTYQEVDDAQEYRNTLYVLDHI
jgi:hypothetical protein